MAVICKSCKSCLLETHRAAQSAIIFHMSGKRRLLAQIELTRNLRIGTLRKMIRQVDIDEIIPRPPFVGLELLHSDGHLLSSGFLASVNVTTEIVMQLNVLCLHRAGCQSRQHKEK